MMTIFHSRMSPKITWSAEEEAFLSENYPERGANYCVDNLDRWGYTAVRTKVQKMKLRLLPGVKARINEEVGKKRESAKAVIVDALIRKHHDDKHAEEIAFMAGVKRYYIHNRARRLGITVIHAEPGRRRPRKTLRQQMEKRNGEIGCLAMFMPWVKCRSIDVELI